jgi:adenosylcobyric acid synthase
MEKLKPIMFVGTGSDVGKSIVTAGFCRIFKQDGYNPAPYKAQNMSLNSFATPEGLEIGRAQAVQAEAAGIPCHTDMNPVLLKPTNDETAQIILNGRPIGDQTAMEYFARNDRDELFNEIKQAFDRLAARYNPVVMEGAGSISEINLRERDITNMRIAIAAEASTYLVADIDRGGIFGSVCGTLQLLVPAERRRIKGIIINKFRGDMRLFETGKAMMENLTGVPVVGIIPYYSDIHIEEEDSVMLKTKNNAALEDRINIAVILLKCMSNFTDFNVVERDPRVHLFYSDNVDEIGKADIIILPGSKNTIADLQEIRKNGVAKAILDAHKNGKTIIGICAGYQMLGRAIEDPYHVEGDVGWFPGLGIFPVTTCLTRQKQTIQRGFRFKGYDEPCCGYEIHMGKTIGSDNHPVNYLDDGSVDGYMLNDRCWGTYMHGILDNSMVVEDVIRPFSNKIGRCAFDLKKFKEEQYDKLADFLRRHLNIELVYRELGKKR